LGRNLKTIRIKWVEKKKIINFLKIEGLNLTNMTMVLKSMFNYDIYLKFNKKLPRVCLWNAFPKLVSIQLIKRKRENEYDMSLFQLDVEKCVTWFQNVRKGLLLCNYIKRKRVNDFDMFLSNTIHEIWRYV
jgi:hypothetical protein